MLLWDEGKIYSLLLPEQLQRVTRKTSWGATAVSSGSIVGLNVIMSGLSSQPN